MTKRKRWRTKFEMIMINWFLIKSCWQTRVLLSLIYRKRNYQKRQNILFNKIIIIKIKGIKKGHAIMMSRNKIEIQKKA